MNSLAPLLLRTIDRRHRGTIIIVATSALIFCIWMWLGAYQSHYVSALRTLGDTTTKTIIGTPKEGRGDEWATYLPILKQAFNEGFPLRSTLKPYFERLEWFIAIPHFNLSLIFLPNYILYWILPGGKALSFQGFYYNFLFIVSATWLLVNLGVRRRYAIACALCILFSQFYQVWWTSNFPILGACLLPFAIFTSPLRPAIRYTFLAWALAHMLFGEMYPPFYISVAIALTPIILAIRSDLLNTRDIFFAVIAAGVALGIYLLLNWNFYELVSHTSYPGTRINTGGGSSVRALLAVVFPTLPAGATGGDLQNIYTLGVVGTVIPLLFLSLLPSVKWDKRAIRLTLVALCVGTFLIIYMLVGVPRLFAEVTGLYLVPGPRMELGFSLLVIIYSMVMISWNVDKFNAISLCFVAMSYAVISILFVPSQYLVDNFVGVKYYACTFLVLTLVVVVFIGLGSKFRPLRDSHAAFAVIIFGMTCVQIFVYGSFNPVMHAADILRPVQSQVINDWRALYTKNNDKPFGLIGHYGDVLRGENLPALEAIHLVNVDARNYKKVFPSLSMQEIHDLFDQFRGIAFANVGKIDASGPTVTFPVKPYAVPFANTIAEGPTGSNGASLLGSRVSVDVSQAGSVSYVARWQSSLSNPLPIDQVLVLHLGCQVSRSWVTRFPVVLPNRPLVPVALQGIAGQLEVHVSDEAAAVKCVSGMRVTAESPGPQSQGYEPSGESSRLSRFTPARWPALFPEASFDPSVL